MDFDFLKNIDQNKAKKNLIDSISKGIVDINQLKDNVKKDTLNPGRTLKIFNPK